MSLNHEQLREVVTNRLGRRKLILVSNREPYVHSHVGEEIKCTMPTSGLVTALEPVMRACGGVWVAQGSGDADRQTVDEHDHVYVPPQDSRYRLRRVWLDKAEEEGYYYGFSNQTLWPLCHLAYARPRFDVKHWQTYVEVNQKFADAVLEEAGDDSAMVFVQDYHFALLPKMLKDKRPDLVVAHFWHIPWPNPEAFRICPWGDDLLRGMLANDLLGFQIQYHCNNFMNTVEKGLETVVDYEHFAISYGGHRTLVRPFPISVDIEGIEDQAVTPETLEESRRLRSELGLRGQLVGLGVDRVDYTKGILERFRAIDRFFEKYPDYQKRFSFVQVGPMSRILINEYQALNDDLYHLMVEINRKYAADHWVPIRLLKTNYSHKALLAFFRLADVCIVSSLHDGMNLVAKEFISARPDGNAALVLSRFTGSARELSDCNLINPFDTEAFADTIKVALEMPPDEKERRMERMRRSITENNIYDWAAKVVMDLSRLE